MLNKCPACGEAPSSKDAVIEMLQRQIQELQLQRQMEASRADRAEKRLRTIARAGTMMGPIP